MIGEELERAAGAPLLTHEQHRSERRQKDERGLRRHEIVGQRGARAVAGGAVADLIVV